MTLMFEAAPRPLHNRRGIQRGAPFPILTIWNRLRLAIADAGKASK